MDSPSLVSSNLKQLSSVSASAYLRAMISLAPATGQADLANYVHRRGVLFLQHLAQYSILRLGDPIN
jgi:hypothetical protein